MFSLIFIALFIMFSWGIGDFILAFSSKNIGPFVINFWIAAFSMILLAVIYFVMFFPKVVDPQSFFMIAAYEALSISAFICFFKAFQIGKISLISPIASSYGIITMVLSLIFLGDRLNVTQLVGILLATMGLLLATLNFDEIRKLRLSTQVAGLKYAVLCMFLWGVLFTLSAKLVSETDWVSPFFFGSFLLVPLSFLIMVRMKKPSEKIIPSKGFLGLLFVSAIIGQGAFLLYMFSLRSFPNALLGPISAAYPCVTIILAHIFVKERISLSQYAGVGLILCGLVVAAF